MLAPVKQGIKTLFDPLFWRLSRSELLGLMRQHPRAAPDDILAIARAYQGEGWYKRLYPLQVESEYRGLIEWANRVNPRIVLEIGTCAGGTLLAWSRIAREMVISVDLEGGIHGGGYPPRKQKLFREFIHDRPGVEMLLVQADSQQQSTFDRVKRALGDRQLDVLFIDGDHRLEGVTRDFNLWSPLVRRGGHVLFHDVVKHPRDDCHVDVLWAQLKQRYVHREIIEDANQGRCGIGILDLP